MAAVSVLIAKTSFPGKIIQSSIKYGVENVRIPFDLSLDFIPKIIEAQDTAISRTIDDKLKDDSSFHSVIYRSKEMHAVVCLAKKVSYRSLPVLLEGETGTGKELFAHAIHNSSPRMNAPFVVVNCGAIPEELFEAELFGFEKGAFTGATSSKNGLFEIADTGTIFLDEIGELPLNQQVKLLRVLQEQTIQRIGGKKTISIDVRIIAATNKDLLQEVNCGNFREDLFYRLAVAVIKLPPLRERQGDLSLLTNHVLKLVNHEYKQDLDFEPKELSAGAIQSLYQHYWPGNIRELINTVRRAVLWSDGPIISKEDVELSIFFRQSEASQSSLDIERKIRKGSFNFDEEIHKVGKQWIDVALKESNGIKTRAAKLLGFKNYQSMDNWIKHLNRFIS
jgi:transcriptional regulator with GAF, ATPase, and Fis domain